MGLIQINQLNDPRTQASNAGCKRIALVNAPFSPADRPSIQCGLLKACLVRAGHAVDVHYLNLELAAQIGSEIYGSIAELRADELLGEWLFSNAAFGYIRSDEAYLAACQTVRRSQRELGLDFNWLCELRRNILPNVVERWTDVIDWGSYLAVGFTCTFEQNNASFALARAIKRKFPGVFTIFGGANFDGDMGKEFLEKFEWMDYMVIGEGDDVLPELVNHLACGLPGSGIPGVNARVEGCVSFTGRAPAVHSFDALPDPNYDDYFDAVFRLGQEIVMGKKSPELLLESARGCWWGEKHHCTFCGLNGTSMAFRSKSPARVRAELQRMSANYLITRFRMVDNIMDPHYVDQLFKQLADECNDYKMFWEVKANLTSAQLRTMAKGGLSEIQPGIESLSTHILSLMRKGITMLKNVRLLKWAHYYGIEVSWIFLTGFPGETQADYADQCRVIPLLRHLPPPYGTWPVWLERFSPYFFDPAFPVSNVSPRTAYEYIYPDNIDKSRVAYFFECNMGDTCPTEHKGLYSEIKAWRESWEESPIPCLVFRRTPDWIEIIDRRYKTSEARKFYGLNAQIYEYCSETDHSFAAICQHIGAGFEDEEQFRHEVARALQQYCQLGLMLEESDHYLSLALPVNPNR